MILVLYRYSCVYAFENTCPTVVYACVCVRFVIIFLKNEIVPTHLMYYATHA